MNGLSLCMVRCKAPKVSHKGSAFSQYLDGAVLAPFTTVTFFEQVRPRLWQAWCYLEDCDCLQWNVQSNKRLPNIQGYLLGIVQQVESNVLDYSHVCHCSLFIEDFRHFRQHFYPQSMKSLEAIFSCHTTIQFVWRVRKVATSKIVIQYSRH